MGLDQHGEKQRPHSSAQAPSSKARGWSAARINLMSPGSIIPPCPRATAGSTVAGPRPARAMPKLPGRHTEPAGFL